MKNSKNSFFKILSTVITFQLSGLMIMISSCQKPKDKALPIPSKDLTAMSTRVSQGIPFSDIMAKLPQTVMYFLGDKVKFYTGKYASFKTDSTLTVRIPTTTDGNHYVYAVRYFSDPTNLKVYLVKFEPENGSTPTNFTGKQIWLDLQDWHIYGTAYNKNIATQWLSPIQVAEEGWEDYMIEYGYFTLSENGKLEVNNDPSPMSRPGKSKFGCCKVGGDGKSWFKNMITGIGDFVGGAVDDYNSGSSNGGSDGGYYMGGNWGVANPGHGGDGPNGGGGGSGNWSPNGNIGNGPALATNESESGGVTPNTNSAASYIVTFQIQHGAPLTQDEVNWLVFNVSQSTEIQQYIFTQIPGISLEQKASIIKEHLNLMLNNPDYKNKINNLTGNWWDKDQNSFMMARKIEMELYLQAHPNGMLDCQTMNQIPSNMTQEVGSYQIPQTVINRINSIRNQNSPYYTTNNFKIQTLHDAHGGSVNCDYFWVKFHTLPYTPNANGLQMTAPQFLEYFRTHINDFIGSNINTSFQPYIHYVAGSVNINETTKWISASQNSLGALVHIDMLDDGSVVESDYTLNNSIDHYYFTFTTMETPLDYAHPVAGNRRFGIFKSGNDYYFYTLGVDRTNDFSTSLVNFATNAAFNGADALWHSVQQNVWNFCESSGSIAPTKGEVIARPNWNGPVKYFFKGEITFQEMKNQLHCP